MACGELGEGEVEVDVVFAGGGGVGANDGELLGAGEGAEAAGYFLSDLDHANVSFGEVVVERDVRAGGEREVVGVPALDAPGQRPMLGGEFAGAGVGSGDACRVDDGSGAGGEHLDVGSAAGGPRRLGVWGTLSSDTCPSWRTARCWGS